MIPRGINIHLKQLRQPPHLYCPPPPEHPGFSRTEANAMMYAFSYMFFFLARSRVFKGNAALCLSQHKKAGGVEGQLRRECAAKGWVSGFYSSIYIPTHTHTPHYPPCRKHSSCSDISYNYHLKSLHFSSLKVICPNSFYSPKIHKHQFWGARRDAYVLREVTEVPRAGGSSRLLNVICPGIHCRIPAP